MVASGHFGSSITKSYGTEKLKLYKINLTASESMSAPRKPVTSQLSERSEPVSPLVFDEEFVGPGSKTDGLLLPILGLLGSCSPF